MTANPAETCSITELRRGLSHYIERVNESGQPLYITRRGKAIAVLLSIELYELMQRQREELSSQIRSTQPGLSQNTSALAALRGGFKGATADEADYRRYLEDKHR